MTTPVPGQREGKEKFEEWARSQSLVVRLNSPEFRDAMNGCEYTDSDTQIAWEAWLSSRRQALEDTIQLVQFRITAATSEYHQGWNAALAVLERDLVAAVIPQAGEEKL